MLLSAATLPLNVWAEPGDNPPPEPTQQAPVQQEEFLPIHSTMRADIGQYTNSAHPFLAYVRSGNNNNNRMAELGLRNLAFESHRRSTLEPAGVVGLDIENDDLSLFPFLLFQVTSDTPRLSDQARLKVQQYLANGGEIFFDVLDARVNNSEPLKVMLNDLQISQPQILEEGHALTQSFYLVSELSGVYNRPVWVESDNPALGEESTTSVIIGSNNWAGAWSGRFTEAEITEEAIRAGLNMFSFALTGNYKTDPVHAETIEMKRQNQLEALRREAERLAPPPVPSAE